MAADALIFHPRVPLVHVVHIESHQIEQAALLCRVHLRRAKPRVRNDRVVLERFREVVVAGLRRLDDCFLSLRVIERADEREALVLVVL